MYTMSHSTVKRHTHLNECSQELLIFCSYICTTMIDIKDVIDIFLLCRCVIKVFVYKYVLLVIVVKNNREKKIGW